MITEIVKARFWSKVKVLKTRQCWLWQSSISPNGYGKISINNYPYSAHTISYEIFNGKPEKGLWIDHKCRNRSCVNPAHLRAVTPYINAIENSESTSAKNFLKTHCKNGHPFSGKNLRMRKSNGRTIRLCVTCVKISRIASKTARQALSESMERIKE